MSNHAHGMTVPDMLAIISQINDVQQEHFLNSLDKTSQDALLEALSGLGIGVVDAQAASTETSRSSRTTLAGDTKETSRSSLTKQFSLADTQVVPASMATESRVQRPLFSEDTKPSTHGITIEIVEARHVPGRHSIHGAHRRDLNLVACLSLVASPSLMQHKNFVQIGHVCRSHEFDVSAGTAQRVRGMEDYDDISEDPNDGMLFLPQRQTHIEPNTSNPKWGMSFLLTETYPDIVEIERAVNIGQEHTLESKKVAIDGSSVLMMITLHDTESDNLIPVGKVLVPFVSLGTCVDQWFLLQDHKGNLLASHTILPPAVRLRVQYTEMSSVDTGAHVASEIALPPSMNGDCEHVDKISSSRSVNNNLTQGENISSDRKLNVLSRAPFHLKMRIVALSNFPCSARSNSTGKTASDEVQIFVSLFDDTGIQPSLASRMEHAVSSRQGLQLRTCNFLQSTKGHFLVRPQCATSRYDLRDCNRAWGDDLWLNSAYPNIKALHKGHKRCETRVLEQEILLRGQTVCAFVTLQMSSQDEELLPKSAHVVIPLDPSAQLDHSWHCLCDSSCNPIQDASGRPAMLCVNARYDNHIYMEASLPTSPNNGHVLTPGLNQSSIQAERTSVNINMNGEISESQASSPERGKQLCIQIFNGRNFDFLCEPNPGCAIVCQIALECQGYATKIAKTSPVSFDRTPVFADRNILSDIEPAAVASGVLKVNVMLVHTKHSSEGKEELVGKVRRIKLSDVISGPMSGCFQVYGRHMPSLSATSSSPARSPFKTLHEQRSDSQQDMDFAEIRMDIRFVRLDALQPSDAQSHATPLTPKSVTSSSMGIPSSAQQLAIATSHDNSSSNVSSTTTTTSPPSPRPTFSDEAADSLVECAASLTIGSGGVGLCLIRGSSGEHVVDQLIEGAPADRSGQIFPGDVLVDIDGRSIVNMDIVEVQMQLRGRVSAPVSMTFSRLGAEGVGQVMVTVMREDLTNTNVLRRSTSPATSANLTPLSDSTCATVTPLSDSPRSDSHTYETCRHEHDRESEDSAPKELWALNIARDLTGTIASRADANGAMHNSTADCGQEHRSMTSQGLEKAARQDRSSLPGV